LKGLRGIAKRRQLSDGIELVRPLLGVRREGVLAYLTAVGQAYRVDSSNQDRHFTRNRIRHELLPLLKTQFNPRVTEILGRLADQANDAHDLEVKQAQAVLSQAELPRADGVLVFNRGTLAAMPRHVIRAMFRLVWEREGWPVSRFDFDAWERLSAVALGEIGSHDLPGGIRVIQGNRVVLVSPPDSSSSES
jgi:tRNA(Ile)-lysidine synthase